MVQRGGRMCKEYYNPMFFRGKDILDRRCLCLCWRYATLRYPEENCTAGHSLCSRQYCSEIIVKKFKVGLGMQTCRTFFGSGEPFENKTAVTAFPHAFSVFLEYFFVFNIFGEGAIA